MTRSLKIIDTQFHVEAGYNGGHMSREQYDAFYKELKEMFTEKGFRYEERENGCPDVVLGKTCLYCHPTCLSGPVEETHFLCWSRFFPVARHSGFIYWISTMNCRTLLQMKNWNIIALLQSRLKTTCSSLLKQIEEVYSNSKARFLNWKPQKYICLQFVLPIYPDMVPFPNNL